MSRSIPCYCPFCLIINDGTEAEAESESEENHARMTAAYRGEGMSFEDDGSPEHDD